MARALWGCRVPARYFDDAHDTGDDCDDADVAAPARQTLQEQLSASAVQHAADPLPLDIMRKYIAFVRDNVRPSLSNRRYTCYKATI